MIRCNVIKPEWPSGSELDFVWTRVPIPAKVTKKKILEIIIILDLIKHLCFISWCRNCHFKIWNMTLYGIVYGYILKHRSLLYCTCMNFGHVTLHLKKSNIMWNQLLLQRQKWHSKMYRDKFKGYNEILFYRVLYDMLHSYYTRFGISSYKHYLF